MIRSFAACAVLGTALGQQYYMLQTELDVNEFVNDLMENGRSKKQQDDVHEYPDYAGHYDFEPQPYL